MNHNVQDSQRYNELIKRMQQRQQIMKPTLNQGSSEYRSRENNQYSTGNNQYNSDNKNKLGNFVSNFTRSKNEKQGYDRNFTKMKEQTEQQSKLSPQTKSHEKVSTRAKRSRERRRKTQEYQEMTKNQQYKKLHQKLDYIEQKISKMKINLQRKKEDKKKYHEKKKIKKMEMKKLLLEEEETLVLNGMVVQMPQQTGVHCFSKDPYSPKHNIYYVSEIVKAYLDEGSLARQHIFTSLQILQMLQKVSKPKDNEIGLKKVNLPKRKGYQNKKTVVFDLDQTLIHCNENLSIPYDVKVPITFPNGQVIHAGINIRPYTFEIIEQLSKNFEIIVFTASHSCYANVVLDYLDKQSRYIHHRLFRQHCHQTPQGVYIKDLRVINRQLSDMVLVDNAAYSYAFQLDNGIPIIPYYHGTTDYELRALQRYIQSMLLAKDMRETNRKTFKLHLYKNYYLDPIELVQELYIPQHQHHHS